MSSSDRRRSDIQLIVVSVGVLVGAAALVTAGLLFATSSADSPECSLLRAGRVADVEELVEVGPLLQTGGEDCAYWIDTADGRLVAYRVTPRELSCSVESSTDEEFVTTYSCDGEEIPAAELDQFPIWFAIENGVETVLVDLREDRSCDSYELGLIDGLRTRVTDDGAVLVSTFDCGDFWLAADQSGEPSAVLTQTSQCAIERDDSGRLRCGEVEVDAAQVPGYPTSVSDSEDGEILVVDLTATPS